MSDQLVSVIMPAFNAAEFIEEAINSVIDQTYQNWELIIINDGSTDNTDEIAANCILKDERIKLISQENKRLAAARNTGILNSKGKWIAFLDADDLWVNNKLEKQLAAAANLAGAGVIFTGGFTFYNNAITTALPYDTITGLFTAPEMYKLEYEGNYIPVLSVIVKREHIDAVGLQDEDPYLYGCEDWDYWLRLALNGVQFLGMADQLFYYRRHVSNMSNDNNLMDLAKGAAFIKNFNRPLLTAGEIKRMNNFINLTICKFIRLGKIKEALFLNNGMYNISKAGFRKTTNLLINMLGSRSYYFMRLVFKASSIYQTRHH